MSMVDVTGKKEEIRIAEASGFLRLTEDGVNAVKSGESHPQGKGDPIEVAKVAAILAVKKTPELVPHCHPIKITGVDVDVEVLEDGVKMSVRVKSEGKTGVEMDALTGLVVGLVTLWDMVKYAEKDEEGQYPHTRIENVRVVEKIIKEKE
ncbi:cyclic pyranopterin monophosphate synthase MoaC [Methanopyrus kandleri]|nr:cyclic pyranopterin monophosphate synthase MoaC [Methanopyrus kandleri]